MNNEEKILFLLEKLDSKVNSLDTKVDSNEAKTISMLENLSKKVDNNEAKTISMLENLSKKVDNNEAKTMSMLENLTEEITDNKSWVGFDELVNELPKLALNQNEVQNLYLGKQEVLDKFINLKSDTCNGTILNLVNEETGCSVGLAEKHNEKLRIRFML